MAEDLAQNGVTLITKKCRNMKVQAQAEWGRIILLKRFIVETINDQLKIISQIEHSRY
ncbi:transposase [Xenorhabdus bovienii]|uniref:transposase n=1 Tax=Xenorhabdus bovienii TaxID=40576 RepID=UPI003AFF61F2